MPLYPAVMCSSGIHKKLIKTSVLTDTSTQFSSDKMIIVKSKQPVPPFTITANTLSTITTRDVNTLTDGGDPVHQ